MLFLYAGLAWHFLKYRKDASGIFFILNICAHCKVSCMCVCVFVILYVHIIYILRVFVRVKMLHIVDSNLIYIININNIYIFLKYL